MLTGCHRKVSCDQVNLGNRAFFITRLLRDVKVEMYYGTLQGCSGLPKPSWLHSSLLFFLKDQYFEESVFGEM